MIASVFKSAVFFAGVSGLAVASGVPQEQLGWGRAQQLLQGQTPQSSAMAAAISEWNSLRQSSSYPFDSYARFLIAHPGWPGENALRRTAERSMETGNWSPATAVAFFRRHPPLTGTGKTRFAEALALTGARDEAQFAARKAWVSGPLSVTDEAKLISGFAGALRPEDHDARMDELLWQGSTQSAQRQMALVSPGRRALFEARLAFRTNAANASDLSAATQAAGANDPGYIADRATWLRNNNAGPSARSWLARPRSLTNRPGDVEKWFEVLLTNARGAANDSQYQTAYDIASKVDDAYPAGTDISRTPLGERDDYTSLVWLAGQTALKKLYKPADAVGMYERYAQGSLTPQSQSKGYYWAGRAAEAAGRTTEANAFFTRAAGYRDLFYGQLAIERLGQPMTPPANTAPRQVTDAVSNAFYARETVRAAQYLGTVGRWEDQTAFVRQIAIDAKTDSDHILATELSRTLGRPDLGVMVGRSALQNGFTDYTSVAFPNVRVPETQASNWTMIHAIARQESQFDRAAISHAGARGLMQLMPGTARETAGKMGLSYDAGALTTDTDYNIQLGSTYFQRIYNNYGSYPLAVAAYNAGPGNVNKWLRANGDPRTGTVDMIDWIEAIPIQETRNYVQRVLENAVVYDLMNPARSRSSGANRISWYLGKQRPG
ncbi:lytic transglycosylase domain-containing protein [Sphingomonas alpina]|uniref:Lytic transglycosylase domain-containing protein n=1 Tax=Sphingomonas alpina TaxID=653931 RepID=A0A7H0LNR9_9SPHN|nr:lytic transglycosylase domain-containing protein [Sphingomonas alpina]QNQ11322.1 lytic transglycosylase domain-containing protein [Sphingomonas alpina]